MAYDERTKARAHEIEALRMAQTILEVVFRARAAFRKYVWFCQWIAFLIAQD